MAWTLPLVVLSVLLSAVSGQDPCDGLQRKQLAGPASEFMRVPDAKEAAVKSHIRLLPAAQLVGTGGNSFYKTTFLADGELAFSIAIVCAQDSDLDRLQTVLTSPSGVIAEPIKTADGPFGIDGNTYASRGLVFAFAEKGQWTFEIVLRDSSSDSLVKVFPFVAFTDTLSVTVSSSSIQPVVGETLTLSADVEEVITQRDVTDSTRMSKAETRKLRLDEVATIVTLELRDPSGKVKPDTQQHHN